MSHLFFSDSHIHLYIMPKLILLISNLLSVVILIVALTISPVSPSGTSHLYAPRGPVEEFALARRICWVYLTRYKSEYAPLRIIVPLGKYHSPWNGGVCYDSHFD